MTRRYQNWIPGVVVWAWLLLSLGLAKRYPWVDTIWFVAWMLFLVVVAVGSAVYTFRHRHETGGVVGYRGVPRWVVTLFGGNGDSK
jgi:hypothetical protein